MGRLSVWTKACIAVASLLLVGASQAPNATYDVLIVGGTVIDGSGSAPSRNDIAIKNGRIAAIGRLAKTTATEVIDAAGLIVAPGFIDVHTHADDIADRPRAENFVRMGVTSVVAGNCGGSALDVAEALSKIRRVGIAVNYATLVGHNTVRRTVMGTANRDPNVAELAKMKSLVWRAMADGAVGFSTGLQYVPGTYAKTAEILELARVAGNAGGLYASHMRNEGTELEDAVRETIRIGEMAMCRVQISHLKVDSPSRWGASERALALIDTARARGIDVQADHYAYTAASSSLGIRFPAWSLEGGQDAITQRLNDPETWSKIKNDMQGLLAERGLSDLSFAIVASYSADPSLNGLSMKQVAQRLRRSETIEDQLESARVMMLNGGASMVYHLMSEEDVERIMRHPQIGVASDSSVLLFGEGMPHPRGYGNNARVLGEYVRARHVIPIQEAVRKMTSLPAQHFHFDGRGLLKAGYAADVAVFNASTVGDAATYQKPHAYATGVPYVLVNGVVVVRKGAHTGALPGQVLANSVVNK
jgi:N-acyl-D-aspartate/D-glutamate deacylase